MQILIGRIAARMACAGIVVLLAALITPEVRAQSGSATAGALTGMIKDPSGAVIVDARVTARNISTGLTRDARSNGDGVYLLPLLPPGDYELTAESPQFVTRSVGGIRLTIGETMKLDVTLQVSGATESIMVVSESPMIEPNRTQTSTTIDQRRIDNLPINRRNFLDFSLTTAGVTVDRIPTQGAANTSGLSFNGQSARQNNVTIDGLDNNDYGSSSVRATFSQEAIQEFQVVSNSYSAEFGRALGGIINIVTRGGTNELHGTLFAFFRDRSLNARNAFATSNPPFKQYQFGATVGGPIIPDRHFFFGSFERLTVKATNFVTIGEDIVRGARQIGLGPSQLTTGDTSFAEGDSRFLGRGDFRLTSNDNLWVRYNLSQGYNGALEPFGGLTASSAAGVGRLRDDTLSLGNTWIARSSIVNETRFLYARRRQTVDPLDPAGPQVLIFSGTDQIVFGRAVLLPNPRTENIVEFVDNLSLTAGKHAIKLGLDYYRVSTPPGSTSLPVIFGGQVRFSDLDLQPLGGSFFTALQAFDPSRRTPDQVDFLNFLGANLPLFFEGFPIAIPNLGNLPIPQAFIQGFGNAGDDLSTMYFAAFAQDDFRVLKNLTVKLGARFDLEGIPRPFPPNSGKYLSPRFAFAWDPLSNGRFLVHGAYGMFHGVSQIGPMFAVRIVNGSKIVTPVLPFPFSLLGMLQPGIRFPESATIPSSIPIFAPLQRLFSADPKFKNGYAHQVSFGIDFLATSNLSVSVNYQMVRGLHLFTSRNLNPVINPGCGPIPATCGRLYPTQPENYQFESSGDSYYHGVTLSLTQRFARNISGLVHYTYSKAIDDFVDWRVENQETQSPLNLRGERGLSLQDTRHRFVASGIWELNYWNNRWARGFALSAIATVNSGRPWNLLAGVDLNGDGDNPPGDRPAGLGRNVGISPGYANVDLRLTRSMEIKERAQLHLFIEAFNLFNRVNITDFGRVFLPGTPLPPVEGGRFVVTPDRYRAASAARQVQFGFRLQL